MNNAAEMMTTNSSQLAMNTTEPHSMGDMQAPQMMASSSSSEHLKSAAPAGHQGLPMNDPENPMNWPLARRLYTSTAAFLAAFAVAFGATALAIGMPQLSTAHPRAAPERLVFGFSIVFLGVATAPIHTPHVAERVGRKPVYLAALALFALAMVGTGLQTFNRSFGGVLALRFVAGVVGGPCLVLIEGTFADIWSARTTVTYYSALTLASYLGAAFGPIIGGFIVASTSWAWTQHTAALLTLAALLLTAFAPETYGRQILRRRAARAGRPSPLAPALSGTTLPAMARHTLLNPAKMLATEPIVVMVSLTLGLHFAVVFQWFVTVPAVLGMVHGFAPPRAGLAFLAAVGGALLAALTSTLLEQVSGARQLGRATHGAMAPLERRLLPALLGAPAIVASLFWIGFTARPDVSPLSPIVGTALYVWGNASVLIACVAYLFDAYPPQGTLSALTAAAVVRLVCAGTVPVGILPFFMRATGAWALATFGFLSLAVAPFPFVLYAYGERLRARSPYAQGGMTTVEAEMAARQRETGETA